MASQYDQYQQALYDKDWSWEDIPFYAPGDHKIDIAPWHNLDYLEVYERVYGRPCGANGIGKLREVALTRITAAENQLYDERFPFVRDRAFLEGHGLGRIEDVDLCQEQQEAYAEVLETAGVTVHWIDWGDYPVSAFGPMQGMWAPQELLIVNGGAIVPKMGWHPFSFGRAEWLSHWAFQELNIPTLLTIHGKGVGEVGATVWLAEDVYVVGLSAAYNEEGLAQLIRMVELTSGVDELHVLKIRCQGPLYFEREGTGASAHVTNVIAPLDLEQVLCFTPGIDTGSILWLREHGFSIVEADPDDQINHVVCNLKILEPGRVVMAAEAKATIDRVRRAGIEVIEVPYSGFHQAGGGFHCSTLEIYREAGPAKFAP